MMKKQIIKLIIFTIISSILFFFFACDSQPEKAKQPKTTPAVVSGTIPSVKPEKKPVPKASGQQNAAQSAKTQQATLPKIQEKTSQENPILADISTAQKPSIVSDKENIKEVEPSDTAKKEIKIEKEEEHYNFEGKINPFQPLISDKDEEEETIDEEMPKRILTPLEKIDLAAIKLVAVIQTKEKNIAMVEEASGKGYIVKIGTYMGRHHGRVSEIKPNSIVVRELIKNYKGKYVEQFQELKLLKKDGED